MRYLDENANLLEELKDLFLFLIGAKSVNGEPSSNDVIFVLFFQSFGISLSHNLQISTCTIKIQVGTKKKAVPINKFFQITSSHALLQDENLVLCLEPYHTIGMERVVHISKFNIKMHAGSADANNYVEYNPVSFGINSWDKDSLTNIQTTINVNGNCFLEFDTANEASTPIFKDYEIQFRVVDVVESGCLASLVKSIQALF